MLLGAQLSVKYLQSPLSYLIYHYIIPFLYEIIIQSNFFMKWYSKIIFMCCLVTRSWPTLRDPTDCSKPGFSVLHCLLEFAQTYVHRVIDAIQPPHPLPPLLLLPSIFSSIRVFSNKSALHIRWPKYWSFSLRISPSNEYSGFISFRIDWFDLFAVQGTLKSLLQHTVQKHQFFGAQPSLWFNSHICTWLLEKTIALIR